MNKLSACLLCCVILTLPIRPAHAQDPWFGTAMWSRIDDDSDRGVDDSLQGYHLGVGRNLNYDWAAELTLVGGSFDNPAGGDGLIQWGVGVDVRRRLLASDFFLPYGLIGAGYLYSDDKRGRSDEDGAMLSLGVGVLSPLPWYGMSLRTEIRARRDYADSTFTDYLLSVGLQIPFSFNREARRRGPAGEAGPEAATAPDQDGDGIRDSTDMCGGTPAGVEVDAHGCRIGQPEGLYAPGE